MLKIKYCFLVIVIVLLSLSTTYSQAPEGKKFGVGIMLGEPSGLTGKYWLSNTKAIALSIGNSYFGKIRLGGDYLWHFNAFNSQMANLYAGPGVAIGIGESSGWWYTNKNKTWYNESDEFGFGVRGIMGLNIVPKASPFEFFTEFGLMLGIFPASYTNFEGAIGFRFYF